MAHHTCSYRPMDDCDACRREEEAYEAGMFDEPAGDPLDDEVTRHPDAVANAIEEAYQTWLATQHDEFLKIPDPGADVPA